MQQNERQKKFTAEMNEVSKRLDEISKQYPDLCEYLLFSALYEKDGSYSTGNCSHLILSPNNIDFYNRAARDLKADIIENKRFQELFHLNEFRVVCKDDRMSNEISEIIFQSGGDWIENDKVYTVFDRKKALNGVGWSFKIRTSEGYILTPPKPFEGFHSSRFEVYDYTNDN